MFRLRLPEPGSELAAVLKLPAVDNRGCYHRCGNRTDAGNAFTPPTHGAGPMPFQYLLLDRCQSRCRLSELTDKKKHRFARKAWKLGLCRANVSEQLSQPGSPLWRGNAKLAELGAQTLISIVF